MNNLINEDVQTIKYLFGYRRGKVVSEQHQPKNFSAGQIVNAKRDIDGKMYQITIMRAEPNFMYGTVKGPGDYGGTSLANGQNLELYSDAPGVIHGNTQLGHFTVVSDPSQTAGTTGVVGASAAAGGTAPVEVIKKIQTILKTKYGANLGTSGPNKDGVDGKWGKLTQTAFENAVKNIKPAAQGTTTPQQATQQVTQQNAPASQEQEVGDAFGL
jgi:hypothetical protein